MFECGTSWNIFKKLFINLLKIIKLYTFWYILVEIRCFSEGFLVPYSIWNSRSLVGWSVSPSVRPYVCPPWCRHHWLIGVDTVLCLGISVLSTYSYHPFISTTISPKILSNRLNLSCYIELLNLSGFIFLPFVALYSLPKTIITGTPIYLLFSHPCKPTGSENLFLTPKSSFKILRFVVSSQY